MMMTPSSKVKKKRLTGLIKMPTLFRKKKKLLALPPPTQSRLTRQSGSLIGEGEDLTKLNQDLEIELNSAIFATWNRRVAYKVTNSIGIAEKRMILKNINCTQECAELDEIIFKVQEHLKEDVGFLSSSDEVEVLLAKIEWNVWDCLSSRGNRKLVFEYFEKTNNDPILLRYISKEENFHILKEFSDRYTKSGGYATLECTRRGFKVENILIPTATPVRGIQGSCEDNATSGEEKSVGEKESSKGEAKSSVTVEPESHTGKGESSSSKSDEKFPIVEKSEAL